MIRAGNHAISILTGGYTGGVAVYWDVATGKPLWDLAPMRSAAFLSDDYVFWGAGSGDILKARTQNGQAEQILQGVALPVTSVAFSRDGRYLAAGARDPSVKLFELKNNGRFKEHEGRQKAVNSY